ncbi:tyrosine-type recombinase/integrase [Staphylococcus pasteuri]|uniref:tyrosine-type recombinase/integrase n=2 Tax=Staphylococcus pasteuri TaxID=45972 RepID=UPI003BB54510
MMMKSNIKLDLNFFKLTDTIASMLLTKGFSVQYVSKRLGHSNIEITWRVYSHLLDELKEKEEKSLHAKLASF